MGFYFVLFAIFSHICYTFLSNPRCGIFAISLNSSSPFMFKSICVFLSLSRYHDVVTSTINHITLSVHSETVSWPEETGLTLHMHLESCGSTRRAPWEREQDQPGRSKPPSVPFLR